MKFISMGGSAIENMEVDKNEIATASKAPVREGYDFAGWYIDKELKTKYEFTDKVTKNLTLYAAWTEKDDAKKDEDKPQTPVTDEKKEGFTDVKEDDWFFANVKYVIENGLMNGTSESEFAPDMNITREQIATIIYRYAKVMSYDVSVGADTNILSFADAEEIFEYAVEAMCYAVGIGLMKGKTESTLNPLDNATRAEIAAILQRFIEGNK